MAICGREVISNWSTFSSGVLLAAGVLASSMLFSACGGPGAGGSAEQEAGQEEARDPNAPGVWQIGPDLYEAVIVAFEGGFDPSELRVLVGAEVRFRVRSADLVHGFLIEGTGVEIELDPLDPSEFSHTFTELGEYPFYCWVYCGGGHPSMMGKLIVE